MSKFRKEIFRFLIAGFSAVGTDTLVYFILINYLDKSISKGISFICGTILAYIINKFWTFEKKEHSVIEILKFLVLYAVTLTVNIYVNKMVLILSDKTVPLAFICATGTSTVLNYIGQKFWVFKEKSK